MMMMKGGSINYRSLQPKDLGPLKAIHLQLFPIQYPESFYLEATAASSKLFSVVAEHSVDGIVGFVVGKLMSLHECDREEEGILRAPSHQQPLDGLVESGEAQRPRIMYILTLGVTREYRRLKIASKLMDLLLVHARMVEGGACQAVFLHVLTSNEAAINFYKRHQFQEFRLLKNYYHIAGSGRDAYTYVRYMNGGRSTDAWFTAVASVSLWPWRFLIDAVRRCLAATMP